MCWFFLPSPLSATSFFSSHVQLIVILHENGLFFVTEFSFFVLTTASYKSCAFSFEFLVLFVIFLPFKNPKKNSLRKNVAYSELNKKKKSQKKGDSSSDEKPSFYENGCVRAARRRVLTAAVAPKWIVAKP